MTVEIRKISLEDFREALSISDKKEIVSVRLSYPDDNAPPVVKVITT